MLRRPGPAPAQARVTLSGSIAVPISVPSRREDANEVCSTVAGMNDSVQPFRIETSEAQLRDLRDRLQRTRWPEAETVDDWSQGIPLSYVKDLCDYWAQGYD